MFFDRQVKELQWVEKREKVLATMWKYRRPARTIGVAVLVGVLSYWLQRRSGGISGLLGVIAGWSGNSRR